MSRDLKVPAPGVRQYDPAKQPAKCVQIHDSRQVCPGLGNAILAGIIGAGYTLEDGSPAWCMQEYGGRQHRIGFCPFCGVPLV